MNSAEGRKANVYIDGFNLYYGCLKGTGCRWLDLDALCQKLNHPSSEHPPRHFQQTTARAPLARPQPGEKKTVEILKTEEKGSDVNLATYLLLDAFRQDCELAVVISNDSDLEEPIRITTQELGVPVGLVNPHPARYRSRDLLKLRPLFFKQIRPSALRDSQFPAVLRDPRGEIRRPAKW